MVLHSNLTVHEALQVRGIPVPLNVNRGNRIVNFLQVARRQRHVCRAKIFFQAVQLCGPGNRYDPRLLGEQPRKRNLRLRRLLLICDPSQRIDERLVRFAGSLGEARDCVAKIRLVELGLFRDGACQEPLAQRAEGNKSDSEFFERRQDLLFRFTPPQ
jgi:hypothetical protein